MSAFANFCHGQAPCRSTSFEISTLSSVHLDPSFAAIALPWARRSGVKPDGDRASSPRRRPKCFRRENLHGIEANQSASWKSRAMRRPAGTAMPTIWTWWRSWRASGSVLTATATAQPEIRRRTFSPHVRCGRRALKRPVSVDCVASAGSSPGAQGPGRCFGPCRCRDS